MNIKLENMQSLSEYYDYLRVHPRLCCLFLELTDACNMSCLHCGSRCSQKNADFLPVNSIYSLLDTVAEHYPPENILICLTGGEPLLHPGFFDIVSYIQKKGFPWGMTTNATLIDDAVANRLMETDMGSVSVSLDGLEPQHNFLRNSSSAFSKTIKGLECLQKYAGQSAVIQITTVVYRDNLNTLEQMYAYISQLGVDSWRIINMEPIGRALDHPELLLEPEDYFTLFSFIREKRFNSQVKIDVTYGCSHYLTPLWEHELRDNYFLCGSGIYVASILCNGDIYSCLDIERRPELVQGNIETDDFIHVWEHGFSQFRKDRTEDCAMCRECSDRRFCRGDSAHTWNYDENRPYICMKQMMEDWI